MIEESNHPQPRYLVCDVIVPWELHDCCQYNTALCVREEERKIQRLAEEEDQSWGRDNLQGLWISPVDGNILLIPMTELTVTYYYFTEVIGNLQKARRSWDRLLRVMGQEGTDVRTLGYLYLFIVHAVLIFGLGTGVMNPHIGRVLGGLHHQVELWIGGG